jgi:OmpA-OmpF porin, OOP family
MKLILTILISYFSFGLFAQTLKPTETEALLLFNVENSEKKPMPDQKVIIISQATKKEYAGVTNEKGQFEMLLPEGAKYDIKYLNYSEQKEYTSIEIPSVPGMVQSNFTLTIEPAKTYVLENVLFDTGKATLKPVSFPALNDLVEVMKRKPTLEIEIAGHTDNVGTPESNLTLSQNRAGSVREYLIQKGVAANRVTAKGYGDTQPVAYNTTEEGKQKNRRTEVRIIKE